VAIAGAGLAGRMLAWRLLRAGVRVTLVDSRARGALDTASMTAAAMLSPLAEMAVSDAVVYALGQESMHLWPLWMQQMQAERDAAAGQALEPLYFRQSGTLVLAHAADRSALAHFTRLLQHKLQPAALAQVQALDAAALAELEPALAGRFADGVFLRGEGQLANEEWMDALAHEISRQGVRWHEGVQVARIQAHSVQGQDASGRAWEIAADVCVDARGAGSKGALPGVRGVRGEVLRVHCAGVQLRRPVRLMHPRYQLYIAPRPQQQFVVGATELESEDTGAMTLRSMLELGSALYSLHPAFGEARVQRLGAALRPALDDDRPLCTRHDGVWHINGLYRHGYLCAPALVQQLTTQILEQCV